MKMLSTPIAAESRRARLHTHLIAGAEVRRRTAEQCLDQIESAADLLCDALRDALQDPCSAATAAARPTASTSRPSWSGG